MHEAKPSVPIECQLNTVELRQDREHSGLLMYTQVHSGTNRYTQVLTGTDGDRDKTEALRSTHVYSGTLRYTQVHSGILRYTQVYCKLVYKKFSGGWVRGWWSQSDYSVCPHPLR